jgi:thioredoxin 1
MKPSNTLRWGGVAAVALVVLGAFSVLGTNSPSVAPKNPSPPQASDKKTVSKSAIPREQANAITWHDSLSTALQVAEQTNRPVLVDFNAVWCTPCLIMKKTTFKDASVIRESKKWVMVSIDGDKQPKVAAEYKVDAYPTLLILKSDGTVVSRAGGEMGVKALLNWQQSKYEDARP